MKRLNALKWLALVLAILTLVSALPMSVFAATLSSSSSEDDTGYADFLTALGDLENYADLYAREHAGEDAVALVINYIRCGVEKYTSGTWTTFCGPENTAFTAYVEAKDNANGTNAMSLRDLDTFTTPNGDEVDFTHMFGAMDMAYHTGNQNTADLGSWAGDICDLIWMTTEAGVTGSVEDMAYTIRTENDKYFLLDTEEGHSFGILDLYGDLDCLYILNKVSDGSTISAAMKNYYTKNLTDAYRAKFFLDNRLDGKSTKTDIRNAVYNIYCANEGIKTLEGTYVADGVNADLRKACCYAFADYLYETAKTLLENSYYKVFSTEDSVLAPGVTQQIKKALTADEKNIVYYLATADITRNDVNVYANYSGNDASQGWKMARLTDQMAAAQKKHSNASDSKNYIENYNVVAGVNADFYNMSNGKPSGALVMEGVQYNGVGSENFFGVLKDGTPIIGGTAEWNKYKNDLVEAVGASVMLVQDGKIAVGSSTGYYNDRVSRTCVGITYDGKVVMMVLDGRQEPFSAGGSAIEIAQIMLEAGCVVAVNLDGGGSSTYATKGEGSDTIEVVNRPSDGYERSVSSTLMIVSTARPSNEFDHAIISADYDYLTVGTDLAVKATGVTSTGGAVALPEGATLKVSDESIGTLTDGVFTAKALGDVVVQLIAEDGTSLGGKTLHVVVPTDLKCSKSDLNVIYGKPVELPLEATYNGNAVKINQDDVVFMFVKVSLVSVGNLEGSSVNITANELEIAEDYVEAGTIDGFTFTSAADIDLRKLTVAAVLESQFDAFAEILDAEFERSYNELIENFSEEMAEVQALNAAISKSLESAASTVIHMYNEDEATFDFEQATGSSGLLAWDRDVTNSNYSDMESTYFQIDANVGMDASYTFALDMSKMPVPEKLRGLLYMLPGGDQEGRSAWDFLLQLAERISPLTNVTLTITVPDGVIIDATNLRLANEYFTLTSTTVEVNTLTVICNFVMQTEPINPVTADPLAVFSGLKLTPTDDAAWTGDGTLSVTLGGTLEYDIYAHFHVLESLASQEEYQKNFGLYPYNNTANIPGDSGAHFMETVTNFTDSFKLKKAVENGWVYDNGQWSYMMDGTPLTGIHKLVSHVEGETEEYWYDLDTNGISNGRISGLFEYKSDLYYASNGVLKDGWRLITAEDGSDHYYYFDPTTFKAVNGTQVIRTLIQENGTTPMQYSRYLTYTFEDHVLVHGDWITTTEGGICYYWAGQRIARKWWTVDGKQYYFGDHGDALTGFCLVPRGNSGQGGDFYLFDDTGALVIQPGLYKLGSDLSYIANGFSVGDIVYFDENGMAIFAGLVRDDNGDFYYINGNLKAVKNGVYYVTKDNGLVKSGLQRTFGADGKMVVKSGLQSFNGTTVYYENDDIVMAPKGQTIKKTLADGTVIIINEYGMAKIYVEKNGLVFESNGDICYYENNALVFKGLVQAEDGSYYYINWNGKAVKNTTCWVTKTNGLVKSGLQRTFGADGKMVVKSGLQPYNGTTVYYENDDIVMAPEGQTIKKTLADGTVIIINEYGMAKIYIEKNGLVFESNGDICYYENNALVFKGLVQAEDGSYYYINWNGKAVKNTTCWVTKTNGLVKSGLQRTFGADGKMVVKSGLQPYNGTTVYYENDDIVIAPEGQTIKKTLADGTVIIINEYGMAKIYIEKNGLVFESNGDICYYENNALVFKGLVQAEDGSYYYINWNGKAVKNTTCWVTKTNGLVKSGLQRTFGADGKMVVKSGLQPYNNTTVYYENDDIVMAPAGEIVTRTLDDGTVIIINEYGVARVKS